MEPRIQYAKTEDGVSIDPTWLEKPMKDTTRHFAGMLIGPVLVLVGLVVDSAWHNTGHEASLVGLGFLLWALGLVVMLFASIRLFQAHIGLVRGASAGGRLRLKSIHTATLSLYISMAGAGLLLLGGFLDTWWHHIERQQLDVFSPLHPYHSLVIVGFVAIVAAGVRLFTSHAELSLEAAEPHSSSPLGTSVTPAPSGLLTILFTDVEASTALTQRLGDARARELLREHERMVREALKAHGGAEVKTMGDGFMASFSSATKSLECAITMQRAFAEYNESAEEPIKVRVGLNAGEPIAEDADLFGTAVNEAARITATAKGGEILVSNVVRELAKGKDFLFADRGEANLKGFDEPVRLYEVRWRETS